MMRTSMLHGVLSATVLAAACVLVPLPASAHTPHDTIIDVAVSPDFAADETLFVISDVRLLRSTNGGSSWTEIRRGLGSETPFRLAIAPTEKEVMYLSARGGVGVYRSDDQGWTWKPTNTGPEMDRVSEVVVSPRSTDLVFATGVFGGLFRTTDGGASWAGVGEFGRLGALLMDASGRVFVGDDRGRVFFSDDDGENWVQPQGTSGHGPISAIHAARSRASDGTVFVGTVDGTLLSSDDRGESFSVIGSRLPNEQVMSIATSTDYETDRTVWVATWHTGVYRSIDNGATFAKESKGLRGNHQADDFDLAQYRGFAVTKDPDGAQVLFLGGFDDLFRSDDDGSHWSSVPVQSEYVTGLAVSPAYEADETLVVSTYVKGSYHSNDAGESWQSGNRGLETPLADGNEYAPVRRLHNVVFSPDYANDNTIFAATWIAVIKSVDGGQSWENVRVGTPPPDTPLRQYVLAVSPDYARDQTLFTGTRQGEIFRSDGQGAPDTWTLLTNLGGGVRSIVISPDYASDRVLFVSTANGVFKSEDAGVTWRATGPSDLATANAATGVWSSMLAISSNYAADGTLFAGTQRGLYVTRDGGQSWSELADAGLTGSSHIEAVGVSPDYANDATVFVSVRGVGLFKSSDAGASFREVGRDLIDRNLLIADFSNPTSAPIQFSSAYAKDQTMYALAEQSVVRSTDGGETWEVLTLPTGAEFLASVTSESSSSNDEDSGISTAAVIVWSAAMAVAFAALLVVWRAHRRRGKGGRTESHVPDPTLPLDSAHPS